MEHEPDITSADLAHGVEMGKINDGYFSNAAFAQAFVEIAIAPLIADLGQSVRYASFGGGEGFLPAIVADALAVDGRQFEAVVVDANQEFLHLAQGRGLKTLCANIEDVALEDFDLITMRSVNHYNDPATQRAILRNCMSCLKPGGRVVSQNLSGPSGAYCQLASWLSKMPELGRIEDNLDHPHITAQDEFNGFMQEVGFTGIGVAGPAPEITISPGYYWARFHGKAQAAAARDGDHAVIEGLREREALYLKRANREIETFLAAARPDEAALINRTGVSWTMTLEFPIHLGQHPAS